MSSRKRKATDDAVAEGETGLSKAFRQLEQVLKKREDDLRKREDELRDEMKKREDDLQKRADELSQAEDDFANEKARALGSTRPCDVLSLSVSGTRYDVLRSTLCHVEGSLLASMFSGRWDDSLAKDKEGNFFIDQPVTLFGPLIDFFRACGCATPDGPPPLIDGSHPNLSRNEDFIRMVEYYGCTFAVYPIEMVLDTTYGIASRAIDPDDPDKVTIEQLPVGSIKAVNKHHSRIVLRRLGHNRMIKNIQFTLGEHEIFRVAFADPNNDLLEGPFIEYNSDEEKIYRESDKNLESENYHDRYMRLKKVNKKAGRLPSRYKPIAGDVVDITIRNDSMWLGEISINGEVVLKDNDLDDFIEKDERFPCYPEVFIRGSIQITNLVLHP